MPSGAEWVSIRNGYTKTVNVAYVRLDPGCASEGGEPWEIRGWRVLPSGGSTSIHNPTSNRWFYIFAEAVDGTLWTGPFVEPVTFPSAFHRCSGLGATNTQPVGFRELDTAAHDHFRLVK